MKYLKFLSLALLFLVACEDSEESITQLRVDENSIEETYSLTTDDNQQLFISGTEVVYLYNNQILATGTATYLEDNTIISVTFPVGECDNTNDNFIISGCWFSAEITLKYVKITSNVREILTFRNKSIIDIETEG